MKKNMIIYQFYPKRDGQIVTRACPKNVWRRFMFRYKTRTNTYENKGHDLFIIRKKFYSKHKKIPGSLRSRVPVGRLIYVSKKADFLL